MLSVWSLSLFVSGVFAAPPVTFEGATDCPTHQAISRELERIVSAPAGSEPGETALVALEGNELRIVLTTRDGRLLGERRLPAEGTCDERALSVAVVLGAWIATAHPEYLSTLPDAPRDEPVPAETPPPLPPPAPMPSVPARAPAPPPPPPPQARTTPDVPWRFEPAIAAGGEISDAGLVLAGELSVRYAPEASGFGGSAFWLFAAPAERDVGSGGVSSFRWPLGLGGHARLVTGGVALGLDAGPMLGVLRIQGEDFRINDGATDVQGGLYAGFRAGTASGRLRPFASAKLLTWLGKATGRARLPEDEVDLPVLEGAVLAGVGFVP